MSAISNTGGRRDPLDVRFYTARWASRWGVYDKADDQLVSRHDDELDAIAETARRNHAYDKKRF